MNRPISTKVFLSSTATDLGAFRASAFGAISKLDNTVCVRMEDFGARDSLPLRFCQETIKGCDIYIGIIGHKYGSHPPGDETSFTIFEYETAVSCDMPRLLFVLREDSGPEIEQSPRHQALQRQFRERIRQERTCAEVGTREELALEIATALANFGEDMGQDGQKGWRRGARMTERSWLVSKLCDRRDHDLQFGMFFAKHSQDGNQPHVYLIQGNEKECPESLVQRFVHTSIRDFVRSKWGPERGVIDYKDIEWPPNHESSSLAFNLMREFQPNPSLQTDPIALAAKFVEYCNATRKPAIAINHEIRFRRWRREALELLEWYLEFWTLVGLHKESPRIFIFLTFVLPDLHFLPMLQPLSPYKKVEKDLLKLVDKARQSRDSTQVSVPCLLLKRLDSVDRNDVMDWFRRHKIHDDMSVRLEICGRIFGKQIRRHMADVESELRHICEQYPQLI